MIYANKKPVFDALFSSYVKRRLISRSFHRVLYRADDIPLKGLMLATHASWWDGMVLLALNDAMLHHDPYVMIDRHGLERFPFFTYLGGFSVDPTSFSEVRESLRYAEKLLDAGQTVWLFPQGGEVHQEARPLKLAQGASHLAKGRKVSIFSFYYSFSHHQRPDLWIRTRRLSVSGTLRERTERLTEALTTLYDDVRADAIADAEAHYIPLYEPKRTVSDWTERLTKKVRG
ncbi:lysophospholipid acyltransferase family protein [Exiguobacterium flavidum]|uniref:lysophospholipid acyltransferase family protein n=1 Tax=Exiguobacterium flavidum TaxID=2184695 RepID=UPI001E39CCC9|nr:lysophospholipid acyltransferase family protein [Exiguobacterium flavidum]